MFKEIRLPPAIARGAQGGPEFQTRVITTGSGVEYRETRWSDFRGAWNIAYGVKTNEEWALIYSFFIAMKGRLYGFRFRDYMDYQAEDNHFVDGDGSTTVFELFKMYEVEGFDDTKWKYWRRITKPSPDAPFQLFLGGVEQTEGIDYAIDYRTGIIKFAVAPPESAYASTVLTLDTSVETRATGLLTMTGNFANGDIVVIGGLTYYMQTSPVFTAPGQVLIGATTADSLANLEDAINANFGSAGVTYSADTEQNEAVFISSVTSTTLEITSWEYGVKGNTIVTTETSAFAYWSAATLTGGVSCVNDGETVIVGKQTYKFVSVTTGAPNEVLISGTGFETMNNLKHAIDRNEEFLGMFTESTEKNAYVMSDGDVFDAGSTVTLAIKAIERGAIANSLITAETMAHAAFDGATMSGGTDDGRLSWTGEFDVPARFDVDKLEANLPEFNYHDWPDVPIVELHPNEVVG